MSKAAGYKASVAVYGTWGKGKKAWQERQKKCGMARAKSLSESTGIDTAGKGSTAGDREREYFQKVAAIYSEAERMREETSTSLLGEELKLLMEFSLGRNLEAETISSALRHQADFLKLKHEMDEDLFGANISIESYVQEANESVGGLLRQLADVLGNDQFEKMFGLAPPAGSFVLIDPEIAATVHSRG